MPGIVGLITGMPRQAAEQELLRMLAAISNQPFYTSGTLIDPELGVYIGWTARRNSFADGMPLHNEDGKVSLVFSGEDFPHPGVVGELRQRGHAVAQDGPSYLVHLYEEKPAFLAGLNGRFHGLLIDRDAGTAVLFNDRYGMHRVYVHEGSKSLYFAAEAKAILAVRPELRSLDAAGFGEYVTCGCVLENRTLFKDIHVLPPASRWSFRAGKIEQKANYFQPKEWEEQSVVDVETYYNELCNTFAANLGRYFGGAQRIGMSVTGGLDTRMILAWHKPTPNTVPFYSFGGSYRESQDVLLGRKIAEACGQSHEVIPVAKEFLSKFPDYAARTVYLTDGCVDVSHSPDLFINERAREIAPVRLTGNYGGEVLRRVRAFKPVPPPPGLFSPDLDSSIDAAKQTYTGLLTGHPLSFAVFHQAPWHHYGLLSLEETQVALRSPFLDNDFVRAVFRAPASATTSDETCLRLIAEGSPELLRIRTDHGLLSEHGPLVASGVQKWLEFTFKAEYAYDYGMPQWVTKADRALSALKLERLFLGRHKFYHFRIWYREALSPYIRETLMDSQSLSRPYIQKSTVERIVTAHLKGTGNFTTAIHKLLTLELLHRTLLDGQVETTGMSPTRDHATSFSEALAAAN